jgi:hypothetical protein
MRYTQLQRSVVSSRKLERRHVEIAGGDVYLPWFCLDIMVSFLSRTSRPKIFSYFLAEQKEYRIGAS